MTLAERLVSIREENGYTRKRLSDELGKPYATITKYENGQREPGHDYLLLIAEKFGVTVDYILGLETKKAPTVDGEGKAEAQLLEIFRQLDEEGQRLAIGMMKTLLTEHAQKNNSTLVNEVTG